MAARDAWIGWDDATRVQQLPLVVNNSRFLVLPWISAKNLASLLLSGVARRLVTDWRVSYGVTPVLLDTLVDPRFDGASYRAANWIVVGTTTGRGRKRPRPLLCAGAQARVDLCSGVRRRAAAAGPLNASGPGATPAAAGGPNDGA
jgi:hypothetical protein